jgi:hypothetical protein
LGAGEKITFVDCASQNECKYQKEIGVCCKPKYEQTARLFDKNENDPPAEDRLSGLKVQ